MHDPNVRLKSLTLYIERNKKSLDNGKVGKMQVQVIEGKSGFVSHTKLIAEATFMVLFHS